jgi:hypothetical protein
MGGPGEGRCSSLASAVCRSSSGRSSSSKSEVAGGLPHGLPEATQWQHVPPSKRRPTETPDDSPSFDDYVQRVVSLRLALRTASPSSRQRLAEDYAALLAEDPLMLPALGGKMQRHDLDSGRPTSSTHVLRSRSPPSESAAADNSQNDISRSSTPTQPPSTAHSVGGRLG